MSKDLSFSVVPRLPTVQYYPNRRIALYMDMAADCPVEPRRLAAEKVAAMAEAAGYVIERKYAETPYELYTDTGVRTGTGWGFCVWVKDAPPEFADVLRAAGRG